MLYGKLLKVIWVLALIPCLTAVSAQAQTSAAGNKYSEYVITDFGAVGDGIRINTQAINEAITLCSKNGGGRVVVPAGIYLSGTIQIQSNVELHLTAGASLLASKSNNDFPRLPQPEYKSLKDAGGWYAFIYAQKATGISITGCGIIDGQGRGKKGMPGTAGGDSDGRPRNIFFVSCTNVTVKDVQINNAAIWNQHYLDCEDVLVSGIRVYNHGNRNNDGIDIDGCRRVILTNSIIDSDDDGIVLKSTGMAPCEDITISDCIVSSFANAIKCGTESTGGFKNIIVSNCVIKPSKNRDKQVARNALNGISGISLEIVDGGIMEGIIVDNIMIYGTQCPLYVRLANRARKHKAQAEVPAIGTMRNLHLSNIVAYQTGNYGASITGIAEAKIENISLNNIRFFNKGGLKKERTRTWNKNDAVVHDRVFDSLQNTYYLGSWKDVIEDVAGYPQPTVWRNLPCYGLFIRHIKQISVTDASFSPEAEDPRPPMIAVDVDELTLRNVQHKKGQKIVLVDVKTTDISR